jgi:alpha/beta hydrolase fold
MEGPPKGMWTIPVDILLPREQNELVLSKLREVVVKLGDGVEKLEFSVVEIIGEWQGIRRLPDQKVASWTKQEQYAELESATEDAPVVLYLHGGGYIVGSIDTHRPLTVPLAKGTNGRVFAVEYRLAPQNPFPSALIDAILAYHYLINPPPGALHKPVDPAKIVVVGDSAGVSALLTSLT